MMKKTISNILLILCICLFVGSGTILAYKKYDSIRQEKKMEELRELKLKEEARKAEEEKRKKELEEQLNKEKEKQETEETEDTNLQEEPKEILEEYKSLYEENSDLVGWIKINDTVIDYPVMQNASIEEANYYLHRDWNKKDSSSGTPFIDFRNDIISGNNLVIYGHNMKNGTMFGSLKKYKEQKYLEEHPIITFDTLYEKGEYEIIGVLLTDYTQNPISFNDDPNYQTEEEFETYVNNIKKESLYHINATAEYGDKLITLCTCNRLTKNDTKTRLIVVGKKIN